MCLVIDSCCLTRVFNGRNSEHKPFAPVLEWVRTSGRMIYGGSKYIKELRELTEIFGLVTELRRSRRAIQIPDAVVDSIALDLKERFPEKVFNDEHIVALVIASRCCVVCTHDKAAMAYLKRKDVFHPYQGLSRPKIYSGLKNNHKLCCAKHVVEICKQ